MSGKVVVAFENNHNMINHKELNLSSLINGYYTITIEDQNRKLLRRNY